jgi:hypothetical protein
MNAFLRISDVFFETKHFKNFGISLFFFFSLFRFNEVTGGKYLTLVGRFKKGLGKQLDAYV